MATASNGSMSWKATDKAVHGARLINDVIIKRMHILELDTAIFGTERSWTSDFSHADCPVTCGQSKRTHVSRTMCPFSFATTSFESRREWGAEHGVGIFVVPGCGDSLSWRIVISA